MLYFIFHKIFIQNNVAQLNTKKQVPFELNEQIERELSRYIENDKRQKVIDELDSYWKNGWDTKTWILS